MDNAIREAFVDAINSYFGCDAAYFGVDPWALADCLIDAGATINVPSIEIADSEDDDTWS